MSNQFYNYLIRLNEYDRKNRLRNSLVVELADLEGRWGEYAKEFQFPYNNLEVNLDNDVLQIKLQNNKNIAFIGDIINYNEEKVLKSITMIASGDGTPQSGANIFIAMGILIASLNPNEDVTFRNNLLERLGVFDLEIGTKSAIVVNDFKYAINFSKEMGLMFSVSRSN